MRVLFGGSFDPVHDGHIRTACALREQLGCQTVSLLPAARSPLKHSCTADQHRLAMLQLAIAGHNGLVIDGRELRRPPPSYTIDTLRELRHAIGHQEAVVWVMGSDTLHTLAEWKDWQSISTLAHLAVIDRPGSFWPPSGPVAAWLATLPAAASADQLQCTPHGMLFRVALPPQPFSSTDIRAALEYRSANTARPPGLAEDVWRYIVDHHLYQTGQSPEDA